MRAFPIHFSHTCTYNLEHIYIYVFIAKAWSVEFRRRGVIVFHDTAALGYTR